MSEAIAQIAFEQETVQEKNGRMQIMREAIQKSVGRGVLALGLTVAAGGIVGVGESIISAESNPAEASTGGYPDANKPCLLGSARGRVDGSSNGWCPDYTWGILSSNEDNSPRGYAYRNCTDWAAFRSKQITGVSVPAGLGNAKNWDDNARGRYEVDSKPEVGDVAVSNNGYYGHVMVVETVNSNGTINISEYNGGGDGNYRTRSGVPANLYAYIDFTPNVNEGGGSSGGSSGSSGGGSGEKGTLAKRADFNGNGNSDLLLYKPGGIDYVWQGHDKIGSFGEHRLYMGGNYKIAVGDFNGNGRADYIKYAPGKEQDYIMYGQETPGDFKQIPLDIDGEYEQIIPGDYDSDGIDDLVLYAPNGEDRVWYGTKNAADFDREKLNIQLGAGYKLTAGKYNNNKNSDVFAYNPAGEDFVLNGQDKRGAGGFTKARVSPQMDEKFERPMSGDFDGDGKEDVILHGRGSIPDYVLYGTDDSGNFHRSNLQLSGHMTPIATGDYNGDGKDDAYFQSDAASNNKLLSGTKNRGEFTGYIKAPGIVYQPIST